MIPDYIDLFLIHWPLPTLYDGDFVSTWKVLEEFKNDGRARSVGVSNFQPDHLDKLAQETSIVPAVNQIEVHPYFANDEVRAYGREHGIATEAWSPIAQGDVLDDPVVTRIGESSGKSAAQVVLRWHIQRGTRVPEVGHYRARQGELRVVRLRAHGDEMVAISGLDRGENGRGAEPGQVRLHP